MGPQLYRRYQQLEQMRVCDQEQSASMWGSLCQHPGWGCRDSCEQVEIPATEGIIVRAFPPNITVIKQRGEQNEAVGAACVSAEGGWLCWSVGPGICTYISTPVLVCTPAQPHYWSDLGMGSCSLASSELSHSFTPPQHFPSLPERKTYSALHGSHTYSQLAGKVKYS